MFRFPESCFGFLKGTTRITMFFFDSALTPQQLFLWAVGTNETDHFVLRHRQVVYLRKDFPARVQKTELFLPSASRDTFHAANED